MNNQLILWSMFVAPWLTLFFMKIFYKKFWLYAAVDTVVNLGFAYLFIGLFLQSRGIQVILRYGPFLPFVLTTAHGLLLYAYQVWQEKIFNHPYRESRRSIEKAGRLLPPG